MSIVRTTALALVLAFGAASVVAAQSPARASADTTATSRPHRARRGARAQTATSQRLLRGINLTSAERAKIDSIDHAYAARSKPLLDSLRPAMQQARADRRRGDSTAAAAARKTTESARDQLMMLRKQQLAAIRSVLTPEQQQQFDGNVKKGMRRGRGSARGAKRGAR